MGGNGEKMCQEKRYRNIIILGGTFPADFSLRGRAPPPPPAFDAHVCFPAVLFTPLDKYLMGMLHTET